MNYFVKDKRVAPKALMLESPPLSKMIVPRLVSELASEGASGRLLYQIRGVIRANIFWPIYK